jgi:TetR/AcrR family transcriptional regulator, transcriptional repressor of aconitase
MPRLRPETRERRRSEIIRAARSVLAAAGFRDGFMQRLAQEAGMSVGGIYRYFTSKAELVAAVVAGRDGTADPTLQQAVPVEELIGQLLTYIDGSVEGVRQARLTTLIWAEAVLDSEIAELAVERHAALRALLVAALPAGDRPQVQQTHVEVAAAALIGLSALTSAGYGIDRDAFGAAVRRLVAPPSGLRARDADAPGEVDRREDDDAAR